MAYQKGKFVWFELSTKDVDGAKRFYGELLGWKIDSADMNGMKYEMINNGQNPVGGITRADGHAHWISYVSVDDVDQTVRKIEKNGGKVVVPAMDLPTVGRFAKVTDPQGGAFFAFRAENGDPDPREGAQGEFHWNELWTTDAEAAVSFYEKNLGYTHDTMEMPQGAYHVLKSGDAPCGGVMKSPVAEVPVNWLPYVQVDDTDATVARAEKLGGKVMQAATDVPNVGRFAIIKDLSGAALGVIKPAARG